MFPFRQANDQDARPRRPLQPRDTAPHHPLCPQHTAWKAPPAASIPSCRGVADLQLVADAPASSCLYVSCTLYAGGTDGAAPSLLAGLGDRRHGGAGDRDRVQLCRPDTVPGIRHLFHSWTSQRHQCGLPRRGAIPPQGGSEGPNLHLSHGTASGSSPTSSSLQRSWHTRSSGVRRRRIGRSRSSVSGTCRRWGMFVQAL